MGVKRPFDEEEFQESTFKQAKQLDFENKLTSFADAFSSPEISLAKDSRGAPEDGFDDSPLSQELRNDDTDAASNLAGKELETIAPLSWITSSSSEEDAGYGVPFYLSLFPEYFEFNVPRRPAVPLEDAYSSLLNSSPRKQVPIGPNYQAAIPPWNPKDVQKCPTSPSSLVDNDNEQIFLGTCVVSLSDSKNSSHDDTKVGQGRTECSCFDGGSVRCVRHHVKEARERFRKIVGEDKFADLGGYDMGEEVALNWTEEEEQVFHDVVYSNPVSLGKNFWKQLSAVFPSRTKKELVSYYFNVFILQRRAVQNRSNLLEIDSDDDEWHGNDGGFYGVRVEDSITDQDGQVGSEANFPYDNGDPEGDDQEDEDEDDDDDSDDGEGDTQTGGENEVRNDDLGGQMLDFESEKLCNVSPNSVVHNVVNGNKIIEDHGVKEDSSMLSNTQLYRMASCGTVGVGPDSQENTQKSHFTQCLAGEHNGSSDGLDSVFLLESCDAKVWDDSFSVGLVKGVDLLPTCNMIEEIFGPCTSKRN